jgi:hypothetical protein
MDFLDLQMLYPFYESRSLPGESTNIYNKWMRRKMLPDSAASAPPTDCLIMGNNQRTPINN